MTEPAAAAEKPQAPATRLTGIELKEKGSQPVIQLKGDGALSYTTLDLTSPPRLVVDVTGVVNDVNPRSFAVGAGAVTQVRTSQYKMSPEKITRVVFDLSRPAPYTIETEGPELAVSFLDPSAGEAAPAAAAAAPQAEPSQPAAAPEAAVA